MKAYFASSGVIGGAPRGSWLGALGALIAGSVRVAYGAGGGRTALSAVRHAPSDRSLKAVALIAFLILSSRLIVMRIKCPRSGLVPLRGQEDRNNKMRCKRVCASAL
jgi:hypothetical protein